MTEPVDTVSAFTIREMSGQSRTIRLVERALPYRPLELETEQRVEVTFYPGNPVGSATVLGGMVPGTSIRGAWKDKYLGRNDAFMLDGQRVETAREAAVVLNSITDEGQPVEVTWDDKIRVGYLKKFRETWENTRDLQWEIQFVWISKGGTQSPAVFTQEATLSDTASLVDSRVRRLGILTVPPFPVSLAFQRRVFDLVQPIALSSRSMNLTVANLAKRTITPQDGIRSGVASCNGLVHQTALVRLELQSRVAATRNVETPIAAQDFGERLAAQVWSTRFVREAMGLRRLAVERRTALAASLRGLLLSTYIAREGDDLRAVSQRFYHTPFEWRRLLRFNQINSSLLSPGQLVMVPRIDVGDG